MPNEFKDCYPLPEHCKTCKKRIAAEKNGLTPQDICIDCKYPIDRFSMLVDLTVLHSNMKRVHLMMALGLKNTQEVNDYSVIRWLSPEKEEPNNGSYIIIKYYDIKEKCYVSSAASYENGHYLDLLSPLDVEINKNLIEGWSYYPYDEHEQNLFTPARYNRLQLDKIFLAIQSLTTQDYRRFKRSF